ncbi:MAG: hypothetical protein ACXVCT_16225, partial [Ktedonobacterales bacterium]
MLSALPITIIIIGVPFLLVAMLIGVSIIAAAGSSKSARGRYPVGDPQVGGDIGVWGGDIPPSDDRGAHQGHHSLPHHHQHHVPVNPGHTTGSHGDFGTHSSAGHGGFDGGSHG